LDDFDSRASRRSGLVRPSAVTSSRIIACRDGEGLILANGVVEVFGVPLQIFRGVTEVLDPGALADVMLRMQNRR
jgi:dipeptidase E